MEDLEDQAALAATNPSAPVRHHLRIEFHALVT